MVVFMSMPYDPCVIIVCHAIHSFSDFTCSKPKELYLEAQCFEIICFADDLVILYGLVITNRMQTALQLASSWCDKEDSNANPFKTTVVPLETKEKRDLKNLV